MPETMTLNERVAEYRDVMLTVATAAKLLLTADIEQMLAAIERADCFGPLFDPTAWREKHEAMGQDKELLQAALPLKLKAKEIRERALAALAKTQQEKNHDAV